MSHDESNDEGKASDVGPIKGSEDGTIGSLMPKAGTDRAPVGRRIVGQGIRRETLKKWTKDP